MESNRDAADQCYAKAVAALKVGDVDKAKRMAEKSIRLFETTRAAEFLEVCIERLTNSYFKPSNLKL